MGVLVAEKYLCKFEFGLSTTKYTGIDRSKKFGETFQEKTPFVWAVTISQ